MSALQEHLGSREGPAQELSRALGWFSVGLGVAQIAAPREVASLVGVDDDPTNRTLMRLIGLREIACGVGILSNVNPANWLWARVGGDVMDLTLLGAALSSRDGDRDGDRDRVAESFAATLGITAADLLSAMELSAGKGTAMGTRPKDRSIPVERSITVWRQPEEVYNFWHNFENLPRFMNHLDAVQTIDARRSHWVAKGPAGRKVEWDAEIIDDRPNELISWRSIEGSDVWTAGTVRFVRSPDGQGTEVHVHLHYAPPGGVLGMTVAKLFGEEPSMQLKEDLLRFKQVMEVGEVVRSEGSLFEARLRNQRPAQPPDQIPPEMISQDRAAQMSV
jgi:uncharacterized membrane protein